MAKFNACLNCEQRKINCHSECEKYQTEKKENDLLRDKNQRQKDLHYNQTSAFFDGIKRMKRGKRKYE